MAPHRPSNTQHPSQVLAALDVACTTTVRLIEARAVAMPTPTPTVDTMETSPELGGAEPVAAIRCREDDELTSLSWLQDRNLLKSIRVGTGGGPEDALSDSSPGGSSADDYLDESSDGGADVRGAANGGGNIGAVHVPYNPKLHVTAKPPYSFSCLIFMAIEECSAKALPVKDIYAWILTHFPYFQNAPTGWKNSVRHNLSLNKCFRKVDKDKGQNIGKGSLWCIDPDYRPNLLQALRKTPYHPYHQLQMLANATPQHTQLAPKPLPLAPRLNVNIPNPELFPYLSKRLAASSIKDPEVDAAATMLALKDGTHILQDYDTDFYSRNGNAQGDKRNKRFRNRFRNSTPGYLHKLHENSNRVITTNPTEDHTYSTCPNAGRSASPSSIDEAFEFSEPSDATDDEEVDDVSNISSYDDFDTEDDQDEDEDWENVPNRGNRLISSSSFRSDDDEERKKIVEGADALLNLAGIRTNLANPRRANHTTHHRAIVNADVAQR